MLDELNTHEKSLRDGMMMLAMSPCKKVLSTSSPYQSTCTYPTFYLIIKAFKRLLVNGTLHSEEKKQHI